MPSLCAEDCVLVAGLSEEKAVRELLTEKGLLTDVKAIKETDPQSGEFLVLFSNTQSKR